MSNIENHPEALFLNDFDLFRKPSHVSEILCDAYDWVLDNICYLVLDWKDDMLK